MKKFEVEYFMNGERFTIEVDVEHDYESREIILETFEVGDATEIKQTQESMKKIKRFNEVKKEETQEIEFDAKELVDKDAEPGFTTDVEDQEKLDKAFNKEMDKIVKFEKFK